MKLLAKQEARAGIQKENEALLESNIRLREYWQGITHKLNTIKDDYTPERLKILKDFETFCKDIQTKKSEALKELAGIQKLIEDKKEQYYAMVARQDELMEMEHRIKEENEKLRLRETFVTDLEAKWRAKQ